MDQLAHSIFTYWALIPIGVLGLLLGSFLNVIIYRYPRLLKWQWKQECHEFIEKDFSETAPPGIVFDRSACPHCKKKLRFYHNIPVISYLCLTGKCAFCKKPISPRYMLVELLSLVLTLAVAMKFGLGWHFAAALIFTYVLITLAFIDLDHQLLPDDITLTTMWIGLLCSLFPLFITPTQAIFGAVAGYGLLWVTFQLFKLVRKKEGMGYGDFKMLAMVGAWFGVATMLNVLLLGTILNLLFSVALLATKKIKWDEPIPFGPALAVASWISMMAGPFIIHWMVHP